jgi:predicted enzyme related to lactoylglutathione lyase
MADANSFRPVLLRFVGAVAAVGLFLTGINAHAADSPLVPPLTTVSGSPRLPGKFVWADLVTDDVAAAQKFYARLFGWTFRDLGGYVVAANDERPLAGMWQRTRSNAKATPRWFGYISVANVARAESIVTKSGGRVIAPAGKLPDRGEQAVFADPEGALFGVVKSSAGDPQDFLADPGDWIWIQLLSRDARKASDFYRAVGRYEVVENALSNRVSDFVLTSKGYARATVRTIRVADEQVQPNWLLFVRVKSLSESAARTKELGGRVLLEPRADLLEGKVAVISDPTGAAIGLLEWKDEWLSGGRK